MGLTAAPWALVPMETVEAQEPEANPDPGDAPTAPELGEGKCIWYKYSTWDDCFAGLFTTIINLFWIPIASTIFTWAGSLLDITIQYSLNTANFKVSAVDEGWKLIRDLVNMGFIFIMLYIAISTILQLSSYNIKSMLVKLIIAAVFINFSLFITRVVMDAGNIVAQNFYNSFEIENGQPSLSKSLSKYLDMEAQFKKPGTGASAVIGGVPGYVGSIMRLLTICVALYVFLSVVFMFVGRIIAFFFLMIFSPIGFIGAVFPGASGAATKWRKTLIDQTLVAPVFIILIYLAAKLIIGQVTKINLDDYVDPAVTKSLAADFFFSYLIIIGFLLMAKKITKQLGGEMGAMVEKFGKKAFAVAAGATLALATGGAALAGRAVVGRVAAGMAASETGVGGALKGMAASKRTGVLGAAERFVGGKGLRATNRVAESSFDVRTGKLFQKGAGALGLTSGAETLGFTLKKKSALAEAKKEEQKKKETVGGYERQRDEKIKSQQEGARKTAAMLLPDKQKIERGAGLPAAQAAMAEKEEQAKQVKAANITPEAIIANQKGNGIKTAETAKTSAEQDLAKEEALEQKAKDERAQAQKEKTAAVASRDLGAQASADAKIQTANAEITRSQVAQSAFNATIQGHTKNITKLSQELKDADKIILESVSGGAAQLASLQQAITDAQTEADRQIKAANDRIEDFAKGITEDRPTYNVVSGAGGVAKGAAIGATIGSVIPIVGTGIGAGVGATVGTIGAVRGRMTAEESRKVADYIRTLHNAQGGSRLKAKPSGGKKEKTLLEHIADISGSDLADTLKDLSSEDQEKLKKALGI